MTEYKGLEKETVSHEEREHPTNDGSIINDPASRSLVRKLDMTLMPIIWVLYLFNYLDRTSIAALEKDLNLSGAQYNSAVSILNVGYMILQIPSKMVLTRVRPNPYIPTWVLLWSVVCASTAAVTNYGQLITVRVLLGFVEAPFFPGVYYLLSCWYTRRELGLQMAILYSGLVIATAFSGLIAAGVFSTLDRTMGIAGWRWLYIIVGSISFILGLVAFVLLPNFPGTSTGCQKWLLSEDERRVGVERMKLDQIAQEGNRSLWHGFRLAVSDRRTWAFTFMLITNHIAYWFNYFYPSIVTGFGLGSQVITLVCTAPPFIIGAIISFSISYSSDRFNERSLHVAIPMGVAIIGFIISVVTLSGPARYFASFLYITGCFAANGLVYARAASVLNQTPEKMAIATSIVNVLAQLGNIVSPYMLWEQDSPRYTLAMILLIVFAGLIGSTCLYLKWDLRRENRRILEQCERDGTEARLFTT